MIIQFWFTLLFIPLVMVKVSKGTTNGTYEQSNDFDLKNYQKRLKTSIESADEWSVDSFSDGSRISKDRPVSLVSDEGNHLIVFQVQHS